jgi:DNA-binding response OmpR family regulator
MLKHPMALLVDDESSILEELSWHLQQRGWQVITAADGMKAEQLFKKHLDELSLVVTDVRMPGIHGHTLIKNMSTQRKALRPALFIMTAYDDLSREDAHLIGADAIFQKPFRVRELVAAAEHFVKLGSKQTTPSEAPPASDLQ